MPTKKKRVGFIPREEVMIIIDKLSIENNLSNSKIISILVEEALSLRGVFNKKSGKIIQHNEDFKNLSVNLIEDPVESKDSKKLTTNINFQNQNEYLNKSFKQNNKDTFDLLTYEKFLLFLKFQEMIEKYNN